MPTTGVLPSDLAILFGTRHGMDRFCAETYRLWRRNLFRKLIISGGRTLDLRESEASLIRDQLVALGMTIEKHWPGLRKHVFPINYFAVARGDWHLHGEFRKRVLEEWEKIPKYPEKGFLAEIELQASELS